MKVGDSVATEQVVFFAVIAVAFLKSCFYMIYFGIALRKESSVLRKFGSGIQSLMNADMDNMAMLDDIAHVTLADGMLQCWERFASDVVNVYENIAAPDPARYMKKERSSGALRAKSRSRTMVYTFIILGILAIMLAFVVPQIAGDSYNVSSSVIFALSGAATSAIFYMIVRMYYVSLTGKFTTALMEVNDLIRLHNLGAATA